MPAAKASTVPAVCILFGRKAREDLFDEYLARQHIERIAGAIESASGATADGESTATTTSEYDIADKIDIADVLDEVSTPSMWGGGRLVILKGAEALLEAPAAVRPSLEGVVARITDLAAVKQPVGYLVLVARGLKGRGADVQLDFKPAASLAAAVKKRGGLLSCIPPFESAVKRALTAEARQAGRRLSAEAADALVRLVGSDQAALHEELAKLVTATEGTREISAENVEKVSAHRVQGDVFRFADLVLDGDAAGALAQLEDLESVSSRGCAWLIVPVARSFERMLAAARLVEEGQNPQEAAAAVGVPRFVQDAFSARLARWDAARLSALLERLLAADVAIKTGALRDKTALEIFVSDACARRLDATEVVGRWIYEV